MKNEARNFWHHYQILRASFRRNLSPSLPFGIGGQFCAFVDIAVRVCRANLEIGGGHVGRHRAQFAFVKVRRRLLVRIVGRATAPSQPVAAGLVPMRVYGLIP